MPSKRYRKKSEKGLLPIERKPTAKTGGDDESPGGFKLSLPPKLRGNEPSNAKDSVAFEGADLEETQKVADKNYQNIENINPVEISKKILLDCNFIKPKPMSVRTLHPGDGHVSVLPMKSVREIYHEVYHKDLGSHRKAY